MKPTRDAGFTLIEALAALAITAALLGSLGAVAGQWLPHWRHGFQALQNADLVGLALDRICDDIAAAEYARFEPGAGAPLFRGEPDSVAFVRRAIGPNAGPRLEVVRIGARETPAGAEIARAHASFAPGVVGEMRDSVTLLHAPWRIALAYAGPEGLWRSRWQGEAKLPRLVRLQVQNETGAVVATTAVALKVTAAPQIAAPSDAQPKAKAAEASQ